jgi:hypothetical protein
VPASAVLDLFDTENYAGIKDKITKAEKAQMKEYFPELYKMQMQMEEDMKNPELERMMKEQEKAIEEMMKGLK